ncbi:hypothetical protein DY000_02043077 [Brassica cretica]|uniref:C2H2-type domain-containing protein n=1 Tax=Brassica cretica TaxID=69181 RepID=A0ABQ7BMM8_BRACR|nr:hypothetical protein DY000_02043077 [Brassica cretica]
MRGSLRLPGGKTIVVNECSTVGGGKRRWRRRKGGEAIDDGEEDRGKRSLMDSGTKLTPVTRISMETQRTLSSRIGTPSYESKPTTGVWCPIPKDYDPSRVRPSIEAALFKLMGPHPVVIYCVGNLEYISRSVLEEISSSGIILKHTPFVFLISGDESWYTYRLVWSGFSWLRAYPGPEPLSSGSGKTYLKLLLSVVPLYYINNYPDNTCTLCEYPYYNDANRKLHLESDEHKKEAAASVSHEKASLVVPLNTSQEKDGANRKITSEEPIFA